MLKLNKIKRRQQLTIFQTLKQIKWDIDARNTMEPIDQPRVNYAYHYVKNISALIVDIVHNI